MLPRAATTLALAGALALPVAAPTFTAEHPDEPPCLEATPDSCSDFALLVAERSVVARRSEWNRSEACRLAEEADTETKRALFAVHCEAIVPHAGRDAACLREVRRAFSTRCSGI